MKMSTYWRPISVVAFATCLTVAIACGDSADEHAPPSNVSSSNVTCTADPRVATFASGISARSTSGRFSAEIVNASPSPPRRSAGDGGLNGWTMKFQLDNAPPAEGNTITATTFMPDHGHGSARIPEVTANGDGTYSVTGIYFFMAGVWEISFLVNGGDAAKFTFCIE